METAKVSAKGWVVIPAKLRKKYRIHSGSVVDIVDYGGVLSLVPLLEDPVRDARGSLKGSSSLTKALLGERKRERNREERR